MAATELVRDALYRAGVLLQDSGNVRWPERELVTWMNDGQRAFAVYAPFVYSRIDTIKLQPGTRQSIAAIPANRIINGDGTAAVPVNGSLLLDIIRNMGEDGLTPGAPVSVVQRDAQDAIDADWHVTEGDGSVENYTFDPRVPKNFYVSPRVSATVGTWVEASYIAQPAVLPVPPDDQTTYYQVGDTYATSTLSLDDNFVGDLVNYVVARGYMKDAEHAANMALAQAYTTLFVQSLMAQVQMVTGQSPNLKFLPFAPQPMSAAAK